MEGPTPVSALIHAATMVTAGVYLIARMHPLFEQAPAAADVGAIVGCVTLLIAATIALAVDRHQARHRLLDDVADRLHDHGRLGRRLRGRHVPPDDARLLQGAAVHGRRLGDRARWPASRTSTRWAASARRCRSRSAACVVGGLALSGIPPFSGFFSKDEILAVVAERGGWHWILYVARLRRRVPDRDLHVPDDLPRVPRRAGAPRRASSRTATSHHAEVRRNPTDGEVEDTDVGFPGPRAPHRRARRAR